MLRRKCAKSDWLEEGFFSLDVRCRTVAIIGVVGGSPTPSVGEIGHFQASGGRHVSPFLFLTITGNPLGLNWMSSRRICLWTFAASWDFATGKSNVSEDGELLQLVIDEYRHGNIYIFEESCIWIGIVPAEDMCTLVAVWSSALTLSLLQIVTSVLWVTYEAWLRGCIGWLVGGGSVPALQVELVLEFVFAERPVLPEKIEPISF